MLPAVLLLLVTLTAHCQCSFLQSLFHTRTLYHLGSYKDDTHCDKNIDSVLTVDGSLKLTTAPVPAGSRATRICRTHLVPFGNLVRTPHGIQFWYPRMRVTRLISGQQLAIVTFDRAIQEYTSLNNDQRFDLNHRSAFPAVFYLRYRYVQFYWHSTPAADAKNIVNITVSLYALFNDSLTAKKRKTLCSRYGHVWCPAASVCVSPGSCTLQNDCFDRFSDPNKCRGTVWLGSSNSSLTGPGTGGTWLSRNLPWLAFFSVPTFLVFALAKICSQKRELDIDDHYVYKLNGGGGVGDREEADLEENQQPYEDEPRVGLSSPQHSGLQAQKQQQQQTQQRQKSFNKSYPPPPPPPQASVSLVDDAIIDTETGLARESPDGAAAIDSNVQERRSLTSSSPPPPPPPPRQQLQQQQQLKSQLLKPDEAVELKSPRQRSATAGKAKAPQPPNRSLKLQQQSQHEVPA